MKKLSILALAAVGLLVGACSSDKDVADQGSQDPFKGREGGFIKVGINLPIQPQVSTRGWAEDAETPDKTLDDGLETEYLVDDCILLLFEGTTEAGATLKQVETVTDDFSNFRDTPNQITTSVTKTVQLKDAPSSNLYAMAVVNGKGVIEQASTSSVSILGGDEQTSITLGTLQAALAHYNTAGQKFIYEDNEDSSKKYFFMTNAVLNTVQGGTVEPTSASDEKLHTLAPVDATRIYQTKAEADAATAAPSCDIYVERGVAKVTIEGENDENYLSITGLKDGDGNAKTGKATILEWAIDNKNESSFVVRNATTFNKWNLTSFGNAQVDAYRFVGANPVDGGQATKVANTGYRTYWAIDPNYGSDWATGQFITTPEREYSSAVGTSAPQYCYENTFPVEKQQHNQTTRVVFKVKLTPVPSNDEDDDFYTIGVDKKTMFTLVNVKKKFAAALMNNSTFTTWLTDNVAEGITTIDERHIDLNVTANAYNVLTLTSVTIKEQYRATGSTGVFNDATVISRVSAQVGKVTKYTDGYAYYQLRIKHFGDDLTPWNNGEYTTPAPKESSIDDIYPTTPGRDANYLGRYGMVRNNWYTIRLGAIAKIGSATVPDVNRKKPDTPDPDDPENPEHPDDELEEAYIKARVNILSWAKRVQEWSLK